MSAIKCILNDNLNLFSIPQKVSKIHHGYYYQHQNKTSFVQRELPLLQVGSTHLPLEMKKVPQSFKNAHALRVNDEIRLHWG